MYGWRSAGFAEKWRTFSVKSAGGVRHHDLVVWEVVAQTARRVAYLEPATCHRVEPTFVATVPVLLIIVVDVEAGGVRRVQLGGDAVKVFQLIAWEAKRRLVPPRAHDRR